MKTFYIALCIFAVIISCYGEDEKHGKHSYEKCLSEHGVKESELEKLLKAKDPKLRCMMACVMEKEGVLSDDKIDVLSLKNHMVDEIEDVDEKTADIVVDYCMKAAKEANDICDSANIIGVCIQEQFDKLNIKMKK